MSAARPATDFGITQDRRGHNVVPAGPDPEPGSLLVSKPVLQVIVASTRPGRVGPVVAEWIRGRAVEHGGFDIEFVDLAEVALPLLDEPHHPRLRRYTQPHTQEWSATVDRADAFVFVMPEYNHGFNAALKNALDYLYHEWRHKPVGFASYGGVAGGTRAVQLLKPVLAALRLTPLVEAVHVPFVQQFVEDGRFRPNEQLESGATAMLDALARQADVLRDVRRRDAAAAA